MHTKSQRDIAFNELNELKNMVQEKEWARKRISKLKGELSPRGGPCLQSSLNVSERVSGGGSRRDTLGDLMYLTELLSEYDKRIEMAVECELKLIRNINKIDSVKHRRVLQHKYISGETLKEIEGLGAYAAVKEIHKEALGYYYDVAIASQIKQDADDLF